MLELSPSVARLRELLEGLDVPSSTLKRDPWGATWLPPEAQALVDGDEACREELRRFVDRELELFGSVRQRAEAMFTARVLKAAEPVEIAGSGLDPRVRSWILGLSYALATVVAYVTLAPMFGLEHGSVVAQLEATIGFGTEGQNPWGLAVLGAALAVVLVAAWTPWRRTSSGS